MAGVPHYERPPGIHEPWLSIWRRALKSCREAGTWDISMREHIDAYVQSLKEFADLTAIAEADPVRRDNKSGLPHTHDAYAAADRSYRRAMLIATDMLGISARARKADIEATRAVMAAETARVAHVSAEPDVYSELDELSRRRASHD